eukprot:4752487-Amphidinium_carterae.1
MTVDSPWGLGATLSVDGVLTRLMASRLILAWGLQGAADLGAFMPSGGHQALACASTLAWISLDHNV